MIFSLKKLKIISSQMLRKIYNKRNYGFILCYLFYAITMKNFSFLPYISVRIYIFIYFGNNNRFYAIICCSLLSKLLPV